MSVTETVLTFVVLPAAIVLVVAALAYKGGRPRRDRRYRPGRPYDFNPVWYLAKPWPGGPTSAAALTAGAERPASGAGEASAETTGSAVGTTVGTTGGASDRW